MHFYQQLSSVQRRFGPPNLKMMFVCGQCWRNGQLSEADKNKKYCSAKARHTWVLQRSLTCELWTGGELTSQIVQYNTYIETEVLSFCLRWAKDRRVVLVSSHERKKWTTVRPLPTKKPIPSQFEVCVQPFLILTSRQFVFSLKQISSSVYQTASLPQICMHVTAGKKCQYIGNCTFAHSIEERDLWTYMKEYNSEFVKEIGSAPW